MAFGSGKNEGGAILHINSLQQQIRRNMGASNEGKRTEVKSMGNGI